MAMREVCFSLNFITEYDDKNETQEQAVNRHLNDVCDELSKMTYDNVRIDSDEERCDNMKDVYRLDIDDGLVDVTDPCYDRGTWCAEWELKVKSGKYDVRIIGGGKDRVKAIYALHRDISKEIAAVSDFSDWEIHSSAIGVDAGLCGFFNHKPDYSVEEWLVFCDRLRDMDNEQEKTTGRMYADTYIIEPNGVCSSSGYGDGSYPLYVHRDGDGEIDGLCVIFIDEGDCDE